MYRTASPPERLKDVITLPPHKGRRVILAVGLWFMAFWIMAFGPGWIVDAAITGEAIWLVVPGALMPFAFAWGIARLMQLETIYISNVDVRRIDFFREKKIDWRDVTGSRWIERRQSSKGRTRTIRLLVIEGRDGKELLVAPHQVSDPDGVLSWAIAEAKAERIAAIDERVRREGRRPPKHKHLIFHSAVGLVIFVTLAVLLFPFRLERHTERELRVLTDAPIDERIARATEIAESDWQGDRMRCRARSMLTHAHVRRGDLEAAVASCAAMQDLGCYIIPYEECTTVEEAVLRPRE